MSSKSLLVLCLIVKIFCTEASIIPNASPTNEIANAGQDCWSSCGSVQGPCAWCGTKGYCCTKKSGWDDTSNGCDGTFGGAGRHECVLKPGDHLVILGGLDANYHELSDVELLGMQTEDNGCDPTDLPSPVRGHASVYSSSLQSLITCGGDGSNGRLSSCSVGTKNEPPISIPPMNSKRYLFTMVTIQNKLYSLGGYETENTMETIEMNATGTWNQKTMPFSVYGHCAIALDNNIIVIGGHDGNYDLVDSTWIYNVVKKDWTEGPKLNEKRYAHACLVDEETRTIHIMGGWNNGYLKSTEKWTFGRDAWISGASLPEVAERSAAVNSNSEGTIGYLVAGRTKNGYSSKVWSLRRRDMRWIEDGSKQLQTPRKWHTVVNVPGDQIPGC